MLLTRGTPVWENLNSYFINVDRLLIFLKKDQFTGYVKVRDQDALELILIDDGDVVAGAARHVEDKIAVAQPVEQIIKQATGNDAITLSIFRLERELAGIFARIYSQDSQVLHQNLHSDFSDIPKFLEKMQKTRFSGYIHFDFVNINKFGVIVLENGHVTALLSQQIELTESAPEAAKTKLMNMIISESKINGAIFNIYRF